MVKLCEGTYFGEPAQTLNNEWVTLSITNYEEYAVIKDHHHENNYLSLLIQGEYREESSNYSKIVMPGELIFRPSNYTHRNQFSARKGSCFNIELNSAWKDTLDFSSSLPDEVILFKQPDFPALFQLLFDFKTLGNVDLCMEFIIEWLDLISPVRNATNQPWVEKIKTILEKELNKFHSLAELANLINAHPVYMSRVFKSKTGMTIGEYQLQAKLKSSIKALFTSNEPISEISFAHGFYDDSHFIRSFKNNYGVSPNQFRLQLKS